MKWVSVDERLPQEGDRVLAFWSSDNFKTHGQVEIMILVEDSIWAFWPEEEPREDLNVSHWMPLPENPI